MSLGWDTERLSGLSTDCHTNKLLSTVLGRHDVQKSWKQQQLEAGMKVQATKGAPGWGPGQRGLQLGPPVLHSSLPGLRCAVVPFPALHQINTHAFMPERQAYAYYMWPECQSVWHMHSTLSPNACMIQTCRCGLHQELARSDQEHRQMTQNVTVLLLCINLTVKQTRRSEGQV